MKARELCEKAWQEIASHFLDFKITKKGQTLKKFLKMRTLLLKFIFKLVAIIILVVDRGRIFRWFVLTGASYRYSILMKL